MRFKKHTGLKALLVATVIGVPVLGIAGKCIYDYYNPPKQNQNFTPEINQNLTPEKNQNLTTVPTHLFTPEEDKEIIEEINNRPKKTIEGVVDSKGTLDGPYFEWYGGKKIADANDGVYPYIFHATDKFPQAQWYVEDKSYDIRYSSEAIRAFLNNKLVVCQVHATNPEGKKVIWGELYEIRKNPVDRTKLEKGSRIPDIEELRRFYEIK